MTQSRFSSLRIACGMLLSAALFACDGPTAVPTPDAAQQTKLQVVQDNVLASAKELAAAGRIPSLGNGPIPTNAFYTAEQIPYQAGPTGLENEGPVCDDCVMNGVPLGFEFEFYGNTYSTLQISSNGFVRFDPANDNSGCCSGRVIPLDDLWNNIIAFAWTDLNPSGGANGVIRFETRGDPGSRRFILHSENVRYFGGPPGPNLNQWLILYEGSNVIEIHTDFMLPRVITQGVENQDGTEASFIPGRVAANFSLEDDGVRFTPVELETVEIDAVFSGPPNREPNNINLGDPSVFVQILNIEQYLPRNASPNDVRIGPNFEEGTPAEDFVIGDINSDGNRDIQLRFSTQRLLDDGHLTVQTQRLQVWGRDANNQQLYRGIAEVSVQLPDPGEVLFNNGGIVTHPGAGPGGADVSMASPGLLNVAGSNVRLIPPGPEFRIADDFTVPEGGWTVGLIVTHAYETGQAFPTWSGANMNIRSGSFDGPIVASTTTTTWSWSGVYRVFNNDLLNTQRPVHAIRFDFGGLELPAGEYWIDWQVQGGASGWAPYVMQPNPDNPNAPITVPGNAQQLTPLGWQLVLGDLDPPASAETPFIVYAVGGEYVPSFGGTPQVGAKAPVPVGYHRQVNDTF
jgi:hypothetical protein